MTKEGFGVTKEEDRMIKRRCFRSRRTRQDDKDILILYPFYLSFKPKILVQKRKNFHSSF
jgi:hypothetical protein